jgi:hypothetical protein
MGKHNQTDHILKDKIRRLRIIDIRSFRPADCDIGYYLVVARVRETLPVSKRATKSLMWRDLISKR